MDAHSSLKHASYAMNIQRGSVLMLTSLQLASYSHFRMDVACFLYLSEPSPSVQTSLVHSYVSKELRVCVLRCLCFKTYIQSRSSASYLLKPLPFTHITKCTQAFMNEFHKRTDKNIAHLKALFKVRQRWRWLTDITALIFLCPPCACCGS